MTDREAALVALDGAIKFESDGRDFYLGAAEQVADPLSKAVFTALADDEADHVKRVREIYEELKTRAGWPSVELMVARQSGVVDAFERASVHVASSVPSTATAQQALATAAEMERRGLAFYRERLSKASCPAEAEFFRRLVSEEEIHLATIAKMMRSAEVS
ncbi:MAG: ferritin family protein [Deltaproteobacteria bacterium]|nr:ferritin family protein [Deltaproteobacteria bacterium]